MATLTQFSGYNTPSLNGSELLTYALPLLAGYRASVPSVADAPPLVQQCATAVASFAKGGTAERMLRDHLRSNKTRGAAPEPTIVAYALAPTDGRTPPWCYCLGSTATCVVSGLSSGQQYLCRVAARNGTGAAPC